MSGDPEQEVLADGMVEEFPTWIEFEGSLRCETFRCKFSSLLRNRTYSPVVWLTGRSYGVPPTRIARATKPRFPPTGVSSSDATRDRTHSTSSPDTGVEMHGSGAALSSPTTVRGFARYCCHDDSITADIRFWKMMLRPKGRSCPSASTKRI
jgi:hypothetical protein